MSAEQRHMLRRDRLIDAGLEQFGTVGYAATSIESLCSEAGVSSRDFYDHFESREGLLIAVYDRITAESQRAILDAIGEAAAGLEPQARAGIAAFGRVMVEDERRARINFIEVIGASRRVEARRREVIRGFAAILAAAAAEFMRRGVIPQRDPWTGSLALIGAVQEVLRDWVTGADRPPLEPIVDELVRLFVAAAND